MDRAYALTTGPQTLPTNPHTIAQPDRRRTGQTLRDLLTPAATPCQAEGNPAVSVRPSWDGRGAAHTESGVRIRNELGEWDG